MRITNPLRLIILGGFLVLFGFCAAFAMVLRLVEATFWLSFLTYIGSIMGSLFAILGVVEYNSQRNWWN